MRSIITAIPIGMTVLTACSTVPPGPAVPGYVDSAEVVQAQPLYRSVQVPVPARECWTERVVQGGNARGAYAGPLVGGVIGGVECEHLAFRNFDTDWQLWVEVGTNPIPRKMIVTSKTMNSAPQYTVTVTGWKTGLDIPDEAFVFTPPSGARQLGPDELGELDELPHGASGAGQ